MYDTDAHKYTNRIDGLREQLDAPDLEANDVRSVLYDTLELLAELVREIPTKYDPGQD